MRIHLELMSAGQVRVHVREVPPLGPAHAAFVSYNITLLDSVKESHGANSQSHTVSYLFQSKIIRNSAEIY